MTLESDIKSASREGECIMKKRQNFRLPISLPPPHLPSFLSILLMRNSLIFYVLFHFILWEHNLLHPLSSRIIHKSIELLEGKGSAASFSGGEQTVTTTTSATLHLIDLIFREKEPLRCGVMTWKCDESMPKLIINSTPFSSAAFPREGTE